MRNIILKIILLFIIVLNANSQNYTFNFNTSGRRVCIVSSEVDLKSESVKLIFHDSLSNTNEPIFINRRILGSHIWNSAASNLNAGVGHWIDTNVNKGDVWEYQVKRYNTWTYADSNYNATGYTLGALLNDNSNYKGQMILLVANDISINLSTKYNRFKKEITNEGWFVNELIVPRATSWDSGEEVQIIRSQIQSIFSNAPINDKPKSLFILGHVPMPRCGSTNVIPPDGHKENSGARGCDGYYADIDGVYTDTATYNPGNLSTPLAINLPNDYKWDQDFFPSDVEMAFGRIDFADLTDFSTSEITLMENYLDRLSNYKNVSNGFYMGENSAFNFGYNNSNDGSFRSLINISKPQNVYQKADDSNHNEWVQNNGPFKVYMQNVSIPNKSDWQTYGMNATVFSSDQSYWGFGDVPQPAGGFSLIRSLLAIESKCLIALWTTTGLNIFHQACSGQPFGQSLIDIINHNSTNQYLEKPPQEYDTQDWWNRTHFAIWGDPTISLFQVKPISNLTIKNINGNAELQWSASIDDSILGYHIYESSSEFGIFQKISGSPITDTSFQISNYSKSNWYMVRAVKIMESGCGKFIQPSLGVSIQQDIELSINNTENKSDILIFPNPPNQFFSIKSEKTIDNIMVFNSLGQTVLTTKISSSEATLDIRNWQNGVYFLVLSNKAGIKRAVIIKNSQ